MSKSYSITPTQQKAKSTLPARKSDVLTGCPIKFPFLVYFPPGVSLRYAAALRCHQNSRLYKSPKSSVRRKMLRLSVIKRVTYSFKVVSRSFAGDFKEGFDEKKTETEALARFLQTARKAAGYFFFCKSLHLNNELILFRIKLKFSDEEQAEHNRIGKEYNRQSTQDHNRLEHDLTNKVWLQQEAMRALPPKLREAAEILDETPPPPHRPWPLYHTPPIKDFNIDLYVSRTEEIVRKHR